MFIGGRRKRVRRLPVAITAVLLAAVTALTGCSGGDGSKPLPSPAPTSGAAETYRTEPATTSLPARWWSWAAAEPTTTNPVNDTTGAQCFRGQPSDLWFLAGTFGGPAITRTCQVPTGRRLYFPVISLYCPVPDGGEPSVVKGLAGCRKAVTQARVTVDGNDLEITAQSSNGAFQLSGAVGSPVAGPKPVLAVAWGLWVGPVIIPDGEHTLKITAHSDDLTVDVTYQLKIG